MTFHISLHLSLFSMCFLSSGQFKLIPFVVFLVVVFVCLRCCFCLGFVFVCGFVLVFVVFFFLLQYFQFIRKVYFKKHSD